MLMRPKGGAEGWGLTQDDLMKILDDDYRPENEMERACFDYVRAASAAPDAVPESILQNLKKHLTPPQIIELACVVGFWKFYNTVHDSLHIPVEEHLLEDTRYVDA
jgi:alkylhydroperoxidase family enzyme